MHGIDRTSKFAFAQLVPKAGKLAAAQFLSDLIAAVPYRINIILTDNGIQFTNRKRNTSAFEHAFDRVCREHQIEHRLTKVKHPWSSEDQEVIWGIISPRDGQVERMNRTIKEGEGVKRLIQGINCSRNVKRFHYETHDQLERHLSDFLDAYNYARRLKTLSGLTPYEFICKTWTSEPEPFNLNPCHQMPGLNN